MSRWDAPLWIDRLGGVSWRFLAVVAAAAVIVAGIISFSPVILPVVLGLLFTCALQPVATWLKQRGVRPAPTAVACVLILVIAMIGVVWLTVDAVVDQWGEVTTLIDEGQATISDAIDDAGVAPDTAAEVTDDVAEVVDTFAHVLFEGLVAIVPTVVGFITAVFLALVVTFFFVKDGRAIWRWLIARFDTTDGLVDGIGKKAWGALTGYILGQTAIAAIDASLIALGALVLGVPNVGAIFVVTFFGAYVPFIGATVAGFVAVLLAVGDGGLDRGLAMLIVVLAVQVLEGNVLQPWIQGKAVKLHPLVIALAITAGGALAGFLGVFLAVPVTAAGVVALSELRAAGMVAPGPTYDADAMATDEAR